MTTSGKLTDLTSAAAVRKAMTQFRELGRDGFIEAYSTAEVKFLRSRDFFVFDDGVGYDSKPLAAAAYGFEHGKENALHSNDFSGGNPIINRFSALGFKVVHWTSPRFNDGEVYTRKALRALFQVTDATIDTGIFRPAGTNSIWLFVTKNKTKDRTQYVNDFEGDLLHWQGQTKGRKDAEIIGHEATGDELLVFYRESKRQFAGAGFRYAGQFRYVGHSGAAPTSFILQRCSVIADVTAPPGEFDPESLDDGRRKVWAQVKRRQGQPAFRRRLLLAYGGRCAVTGCAIEPLLEAAHIRPYLGELTNVTPNGLLLRADIHTLFDLGLIALKDDRAVLVADRLNGTNYAALAGTVAAAPSVSEDQPSSKALTWHRREHGWEET